MALSTIRRSLTHLLRISIGDRCSLRLNLRHRRIPSFLACASSITGRSASTAGTMASTGDGAGGPASSGRRARLDLNGVYPPIATPFDDNENVDYNKLGFNLQRWNDIPFKGIF